MSDNTDGSAASTPATRNRGGSLRGRRNRNALRAEHEAAVADAQRDAHEKVLANARLWGMEYYREKIRAAADLMSQGNVHSSSEHMAQVEALLDDADRVRNLARRIAEATAFSDIVARSSGGEIWDSHYCYDDLDWVDRRVIGVICEVPSDLV